MLEIQNLTKTFKGHPVLNEVNLQVGPHIKVIIGLNGSGKSTLLKIIAGILPGDSGKIIIQGKDVTQFPPENRYVGYVPQHPALFKHLSTWENICYSFKNNRGTLEAAQTISEMLNLTGVLHKKPNELSGGFKSRASLARALASNPRLMLLDEPLSEMDMATKENLLPQFREVLKKIHIPVLYVTHDLQEAEILGDTFSVMVDGQLQDISNAQEAFEMIMASYLAARGEKNG